MQPLHIRERGCAHPELLADTDWLADRLTDPKLRLIDARQPEQYAANHIPGAVNLSVFGGIPRADNGDMANPDEFASLAGSLGIGNDVTVVVYDAPSQMMGMVAWAFLYYGHGDVRILDRGLAKWTRENRSLSPQATQYPPAVFAPEPQEAIYCSLNRAQSNFGRSETLFWDTRSLEEFEGTAAGFGPPVPLGRIPNAIHLDWRELFDQDTNTLKPASTLDAILESRGLTPESEIDAY
ncbi:MAG: rhodanese-like domain-containing protein [SAR202 cluster bacterium]|nr:rhodanese-like domain-containing protein [SAR202 cluster bacterium]MDP6302161.1 rhodanese-like domain-containing protein [SAR202 cluster bacterium]MDP7104880.1 rhodanese-like domain-containing protein [SAR202 cluster bacterium]MDP7413828.1 rhodanese-like domain-containing protein [SAR202 cluster bacterium]